MTIILAVKQQSGNPIVFYDSCSTDGRRWSCALEPKAYVIDQKARALFGFSGLSSVAQSIYLGVKAGALELDRKSLKNPNIAALIWGLTVDKHVRDQPDEDDEDYGGMLTIGDSIYTINNGAVLGAGDFAAVGSPAEFVMGALHFGLDRSSFEAICDSVRRIFYAALIEYEGIAATFYGICIGHNNDEPFVLIPGLNQSSPQNT